MRSKRLWIGACCLLAVYAALAHFASRHVGVTTDESVGIAGGFEFLTRREMHIHYEHPPLVKALAALPLLGYHDPIDPKDPLYSKEAEWRYGDRFMFEGGVPVDGILYRSRIVPLLLAVLLGFSIFLVSRRANGTAGGLLSLAFFAFDPAMLGLGPLAQLDVGVTLFVFCACLAFHAALKASAPSLAAFLPAGLFLGLGMASKFSALAALPLFCILALAERRVDRQAVKGLMLSMVTAVAVLVLCYQVVLVPDLWRGFTWQIGHAHSGHPSYLLGKVTDKATLLAFPITFLLKVPIETLGALLLTLLAFRADPRSPVNKACFACAATFFLLMLTSSIAIGFRYLLPCYPFLLVLLGSLWRRLKIPAVTLVVLLAIEALSAYPNYIGYTNGLAGSRPELYIADSNLDMGQDLPALSKYLERLGNPECHLFYMGMDRPAARGIAWLPFPCHREPGLYAISVNVAVGIYPPSARRCVAWLKKETPIDRVGTSILIYRIR